MKKWKLTAIAALAAFSTFGSAAAADTAPATTTTAATPAAKTSADFKDLGSINADLKAKIDALLAKGIMEGVAADSFGIQENMTRAQFAKVLDLSSNVPVDMKITVSSFTDVKADDQANGWSIPYVEAAKKAGLVDGMTDTTFAPGDKVSVGQLATALLKGSGKKVDLSGSPWYAKAVQQAKDLKLIAANADGSAMATRTDLVIGAYGLHTAFQQLPKPVVVQVSIASVKATDARHVQVSMDQPVDTAKAVLKLSKGTKELATTTTWSNDGKTATLTLTGDTLATADYTATLSGLDAAMVKSGTATLRYESPKQDNPAPATTAAYVLPNVIDSGITALATGGDFATRTQAEDPTQSKFAQEIIITAKDAAGDPVALPGVIQTMVSSNPGVAKVGVAGDHRGYVLGNKAGTAIINLTYRLNSGDMKQMNVPIEVKPDPISVVKLVAGKTANSVSQNANPNAFAAMHLTITDNYGVEYENNETTLADGKKYNFSLGIMFSITNIRGNSGSGVGTVAVDNAGNLSIVGNVTSFDLTAVSFGSKETTTAITVQP